MPKAWLQMPMASSIPQAKRRRHGRLCLPLGLVSITSGAAFSAAAEQISISGNRESEAQTSRLDPDSAAYQRQALANRFQQAAHFFKNAH